KREMHNAEIRNDDALNRKAHLKPNCATLAPPRNAPIARVVHCVVCVSEFAVCNSSFVAMAGRMAARPAVKNGEAAISKPLSRYSSHVLWRERVRRKRAAMTARQRT